MHVAGQVGSLQRGVDREQRDALGLGRGDLRAERIRLHRNDDDGVHALVDQRVDLAGLGGHVVVGRVPHQLDVVGLGVGVHPLLALGDERAHVVHRDADALGVAVGRGVARAARGQAQSDGPGGGNRADLRRDVHECLSTCGGGSGIRAASGRGCPRRRCRRFRGSC
ncbi:hypothetical protein MSMEG_3600 [Mycolicibacterium smegmatis MC2 155]|uniref:Uncharacterized protein n=1 Tax=Mycolicibacterium smegmatis (strain ATCC 700084 / mc(2)155) TaxID=246196 RepID=A0QYB4_MYCS2|nr:hypothetical protein MSMEG_3600 [Mycolicibacterium smegmatis MC2 155]